MTENPTEQVQTGDVRRVFLWGSGDYRLGLVLRTDPYEQMALVKYPEHPNLRPEWVRFDQLEGQ